jgi:hypothetical protein
LVWFDSTRPRLYHWEGREEQTSRIMSHRDFTMEKGSTSTTHLLLSLQQ